MVRAFGDDLLRVIAEVGMVFHPTVSPSVSLVDDIWFGFVNHYIKGTMVWTRYVLVMQCLSCITMLSLLRRCEDTTRTARL